MQKKYYIGIDMGTDSVGWAATDEEYNLLKARGQELWGSYLFEEAHGAAERRAFRTARRRTARRWQRLLLLQSLFAEEIAKLDPLFFLRLNNSSLFFDDKENGLSTADSLFADKNFCDKEYFKRYPTVYHLRAALLQGAETDLRLLYLAVHHIVKNRGHFLFENRTFNAEDTSLIIDKLTAVNSFLEEREKPTFTLKNAEKALGVLRKKDLSKRDRQKQLGELLGAGKERPLLAVVKAITGGNVNVSDLYDSEEDFDPKSFSFEKENFDESVLPQLVQAAGEDDAELIRLCKAIYDWTVLCDILKGEKFLSVAKCNTYDAHRDDLQWLKGYVRAHCPEKYADVFRRREKKGTEKANYAAYVGRDGKKSCKKCSRDEFYAFLKKEIKIDDETVLARMDTGDFLPKQVSDANGIIPYQVHLQELEEILTRAEQHFPFLKAEQDGATVKEKILSLMKFRIPYYVGPLHTASPFAWAKRRPGYEAVSVNAWNFEKAIDKDASEEAFIRRMTNKCTYLAGEDVLPASSLLYSEFTFLNELNNLKINGEKNERARRLIYGYAKEHKKVTLKACLKLLIQEGVLEPNSRAEEVFSGIDGDFKTSLSSWCDLRFLGDKRDTRREMCEEIIVWITLLSDKDRLEQRIRSKYGKDLSEEEIKRFKGLNYTKWGRLSAKLLCGIESSRCLDAAGAPMTILQAMRGTGENFMQLLSAKYGFADAIRTYNEENAPSEKVTYRTVEELYCSPAVKRAIWRTVELVRELVKLCGTPAKLFLETAREANDDSRKGKRTVSRKQQLLRLYESIREEQRDWEKELQDTPDLKFNSDKLVLYYRQMGRCMYSGAPIPLDRVFDTNFCDIDHIYPQSKIKDDSLDNRVLVFKHENAKKRDEYPVSAAIRQKMQPFWQKLKEKGLISETKYERLTRSTKLTQDELADFLNRQLVYTRQSTKAAAQLLQKMLPNTEIVYAKAANAAVFKDRCGIRKVRELNDLHHAKDAYINIVVGNVYNTKFSHDAAAYFRSHAIESYNIDRLYDSDIPGAWRTVWQKRILQTAARNTCRVVRMTHGGAGALFDVNPVPAGKNDGLVPLKKHDAIADTKKYGGYNKAATAYFLLVKSVGEKKKTLLSLEAYPLWLEKQTQGGTDAKLHYCADTANLHSPQILLDRIKLDTLLCFNGSYAYLRGKTGDRILLCNANQLFLDDKSVQTLKNVCNYMRDRKKYNNSALQAGEKIRKEENLALYDAIVQKLDTPRYKGLPRNGQTDLLREQRERFAALSAEEQCAVLFEILHLAQCNSVHADLSLLGGSKHAGATSSSKFIQNNEVKLIFQSPTGYYRRVVDCSKFL